MKKKKRKILIFSGAGIDKESGIQTFRDSKDSLWNNHKIEEVASIEAWGKNPQLVLDFYNHRRREVLKAEPNRAHYLLADLENEYDVVIVTQNVSNLHERAGSSKIYHLHGELLKSRSLEDDSIHNCVEDLKLEDNKRPHIVWFGEGLDTDILSKVNDEASDADICLIIGTSMKVFPANTIPFLTKHTCMIYYVDPSDIDFYIQKHRLPYFQHIKDIATIGVGKAIDEFKDLFTV